MLVTARASHRVSARLSSALRARRSREASRLSPALWPGHVLIPTRSKRSLKPPGARTALRRLGSIAETLDVRPVAKELAPLSSIGRPVPLDPELSDESGGWRDDKRGVDLAVSGRRSSRRSFGADYGRRHHAHRRPRRRGRARCRARLHPYSHHRSVGSASTAAGSGRQRRHCPEAVLLDADNAMLRSWLRGRIFSTGSSASAANAISALVSLSRSALRSSS